MLLLRENERDKRVWKQTLLVGLRVYTSGGGLIRILWSRRRNHHCWNSLQHKISRGVKISSTFYDPSKPSIFWSAAHKMNRIQNYKLLLMVTEELNTKQSNFSLSLVYIKQLGETKKNDDCVLSSSWNDTPREEIK